MTADAPIQKILMTADTVGGVWTYSMELCRGLSGRGVHITLATMGAPLTSAQRREAAQIKNLDIAESSWRLEWMENPWADVARAGEWLLDLAGKVRPEVVHLNGYVHATLKWTMPVLVAGHSCVLSWWRAVKGTEAPSEWDRYRRLVAEGLQAASTVIAPSQTMLDALEEHYGLKGTRSVIYNGRDPELFRPAPKEALVFSAGRIWDEAKNIEAVLRAAARIDWPVYVAGDPRHPDGRSKTLDGVVSLGALDHQQIRGWLARTSIFVLPARYDPFGLTALEAALSGCALVLGDIPSLREVWGDCAIYVPPEDDRTLSMQVNLLISDIEFRRQMASLAYERALRYSPGAMVRQYLGAYTVLRQRELTCAS